MSEYSIEDIKKFLPHRYPFLMVDKVIDVDPGKSIIAVKNVTINEPYFNGHFPSEAVMPGVLMIESMAQVAGVLGMVSEGRKGDEDVIYLLCGLSKTRFRRKVTPGDQLVVYAKLLTMKRNILKFDCEARVDDKLVASTELLVAEEALPDVEHK